MKKLFFAALVAVAAVGGAYAIPVANSTGSYIGDCLPQGQTSCEVSNTYFRVGTTTPYTPTELEGLFFNQPEVQ